MNPALFLVTRPKPGFYRTEIINRPAVMKKLFLLAMLTACVIDCAIAQSSPTGTINGHGYVDLGLPSGTLWATCNIGASSLASYGEYFAWGEVQSKSNYYFQSGRTYKKTIPEIVGNPKYDAARLKWGSGWRLPSKAEFKELIDKCTWVWTNLYGHEGYKIVGPNDNSIFLPAAGQKRENTYFENIGRYWSYTQTKDNHDAWGLVFSRYYMLYADPGIRNISRYWGLSIRPVVAKRSEAQRSSHSAQTANSPSRPSDGLGTITGHDYVDLGLPSGKLWATCNVGASSPSDFGDYFAWGETSPKSTYTKENSKTYDEFFQKIPGNYLYDAAQANWDGTWHIPSKSDFEELKNKCTWTWTNQAGKKGYKVTGPNGNSIFLPAAGYRSANSLSNAGSEGLYWSSTPGGYVNDCGSYLFIDSRGYGVYIRERAEGLPIRPVAYKSAAYQRPYDNVSSMKIN